MSRNTLSSIPPNLTITVPEDGVVTLPIELRGFRVVIRPGSLDGNLERNEKSLEEIVAEQGGPKKCTSIRELSEGFPKLFDTDEEVENFIHRRKLED